MLHSHHKPIHRYRGKDLGLAELIAIAFGGMVGGGIFTILGISVSMIGMLTPIAIIIGGVIAAMAAYSYVKLGLYYRDEGPTYSFYKKMYADSPFAGSVIRPVRSSKTNKPTFSTPLDFIPSNVSCHPEADSCGILIIPNTSLVWSSFKPSKI